MVLSLRSGLIQLRLYERRSQRTISSRRRSSRSDSGVDYLYVLWERLVGDGRGCSQMNIKTTIYIYRPLFLPIASAGVAILIAIIYIAENL